MNEPLSGLPMNTRFRHEGVQYVIVTPASDHPWGHVETIDVYGGRSRDFTRPQNLLVEVLP